MDETTFDTLTRRAGSSHSRRGSRRAFGAAVAVAVALSPGLTAAKRRCRKKCKKCDPRPPGASCRINAHCCANETNRICAFAFNDTTATLTCCGGTQAECMTDDDCCQGFSCDNGLCDL